jgi:hypothetical protein
MNIRLLAIFEQMSAVGQLLLFKTLPHQIPKMVELGYRHPKRFLFWSWPQNSNSSCLKNDALSSRERPGAKIRPLPSNSQIQVYEI